MTRTSKLAKYKNLYGEDTVIVFKKQDAIDITDSGDNFKKRNSVVYATNMELQNCRQI
jgi:hypothetical protein